MLDTVWGQFDTCNTQSDEDESHLCRLDTEGMESLSVKQIEHAQAGKPSAKLFSDGARVQMSKKYGGDVLPDFIANPHKLMIVNLRVKKIIESLTTWPTEYLTLTLLDKKGKVASSDYFIVNPIDTFDALDTKKSTIQKLAPGVVMVHKMVLDWKKMDNAPDLFRPKEDPLAYIFSRRVAKQLRALKKPAVSNLHYVDLFDRDE